MGAVATVMEKFLKLEKKDLSILSFFTQMTIIGWKVSVVSVNRNAGFPKGCGRLVVVGGNNLGKMATNCMKITKLAFLGQNSGSETWGGRGGGGQAHTYSTHIHTYSVKAKSQAGKTAVGARALLEHSNHLVKVGVEATCLHALTLFRTFKNIVIDLMVWKYRFSNERCIKKDRMLLFSGKRSCLKYTF